MTTERTLCQVQDAKSERLGRMPSRSSSIDVIQRSLRPSFKKGTAYTGRFSMSYDGFYGLGCNLPLLNVMILANLTFKRRTKYEGYPEPTWA